MSSGTGRPLRDFAKDWKNDIVSGPFGSNLKREHYVRDGVPVLKIQNVRPMEVVTSNLDFVEAEKASELSRHSFQSGDVLITKLGLPLGAAAVVDDIDHGIIVADLVRIRPDPSWVDPIYLAYAINSPTVKRQLNKSVGGATRPRINLDDVRNAEIPAYSLNDQRGIVAKLDQVFAEIDRAIENTERAMAEAERIETAVLADLFDDAPLFEFLEIREIAQVFDGPHATPKTVDEGPVFLGIRSIDRGLLNLTKTRHVTADDFEKWTRRVTPRTNDIVFSYETKLGVAALIPEGLTCCLGRRMGLVRCDEKRVLPEFFLLQYLSSPFQEYLDQFIIHGVTVDRLSIRDFPSFRIWVPPLSRQRDIIEKASLVQKESRTLEKSLSEKLAALRALKQSILAETFSFPEESDP